MKVHDIKDVAADLGIRNLDEIVDRVLDGEEIFLALDGKPVAQILPYEESDKSSQ